MRTMMLAETADTLPEIGNPYAAGLVDLPETLAYSPIALTDDGATLCVRCVLDPANPVHPPDGTGLDADGWRVDAWTYDGAEDGPLGCDHCAAVIIAGEDEEADA